MKWFADEISSLFTAWNWEQSKDSFSHFIANKMEIYLKELGIFISSTM